MIQELFNKAIEVRKNAYAKHTPYYVGAALLTKSGKIYTGCNIQNDGINSICAERVAFTKALSEGNHEFSCLAVVGKPLSRDYFSKTLPCGYCRQFLSEYTSKDFLIYTYDDEENKLYTYRLEELLPESFSL